MITITDTAVEKSKEILTAEGKTAWGFRIFLAGSSCCGPSFGMDLSENPEKGDEVIKKNDVKFFIDKNALEKLKGMELHFMDDGDQSGFVIKGGQAPSCNSGCGH